MALLILQSHCAQGVAQGNLFAIRMPNLTNKSNWTVRLVQEGFCASSASSALCQPPSSPSAGGSGSSASAAAGSPMVSDPFQVGLAVYNGSMNVTGWDYLAVQPSPHFFVPSATVETQSEGFRVAGLLEGYLTADRIWDNYVNTVQLYEDDYFDAANVFVQQHISYLQGIAENHAEPLLVQGSSNLSSSFRTKYIGKVSNLWAQLNGLVEGYNRAVSQCLVNGGGATNTNATTSTVNGSTNPLEANFCIQFPHRRYPAEPLSLFQLFVLNYQAEYSDVQAYVATLPVNITAPGSDSGASSSSATGNMTRSPTAAAAAATRFHKERLRSVFKSGMHCSALIKVITDSFGYTTDLYAAHNTWSTFNSMLRQYKVYMIGRASVSMSSYPGMLSSLDDWYITSPARLSVIETTNEIYNTTMYSAYFSSNTVAEWMRVMVANYLASNGDEWTAYFTYLNSGSYNDQWMVTDMKLFTTGVTVANLPNNLLWIAETVPGYTERADVTSVLRSQGGYWASYNSPYFRKIYELAGYQTMKDLYGSFYDHQLKGRALIFARNQSMVTDLESMKALMRYNNYEYDPLSDIPNCTGTIYNNTCIPKRSALLTIAARGDLDPVPNVHRMGPLAADDAGGIVGMQNEASIDCKIAVWSNMQTPGKFRGVVIDGPTYDQQPAFDFRNIHHYLHSQVKPREGLPNLYRFPWVEYDTPDLLPRSLSIISSAALDSSGSVQITPFSSVPVSNGTANATAVLLYNASMNVTGWDVVTVTVPRTTEVIDKNPWYYYTAGYLEAYYTAESIYDLFLDFVLDDFAYSPNYVRERAFIQSQLDFMTNMSFQPHNPVTTHFIQGYNKQLRKFLLQLQGMAAGYAQFMSDYAGLTYAQPMSMFDLHLISYDDEVDDVELYYALLDAVEADASGEKGIRSKLEHVSNVDDLKELLAPSKKYPFSKSTEVKLKNKGQHCSALIKVTSNDLFVSHNTWSNYNNMLRQYKSYVFEVTVSFSSYPGMLTSTDDWYMTSLGLAVQETTNPIYNYTLYTNYFTPKTVSAWMRAMIATFLSDTAMVWHLIFVSFNSGSYNNQWMSVDMKLFTPGTALASLPNDLVWVSETLPGFYQMADVTDVIRQQGYWASYNVPYFPFIFDISGNLKEERKYGSFFSYTNYSRAQIFRRNQSMINDLIGMKSVMRYNDFQNDPLCDIPNCTGTIYGSGICLPKRSSMLAVSSRGDLDPIGSAETMGPLASSNNGYVGQQDLAALDCKIASWQSMENSSNQLVGVVISGPTYDQQPPFDFRTAPSCITSRPWRGMPNVFQFPWVTYAIPESKRGRLPAAPPQKSPAILHGIVGAIGGILAVMVSAVGFWEYRRRKQIGADFGNVGGKGGTGSSKIREGDLEEGSRDQPTTPAANGGNGAHQHQFKESSPDILTEGQELNSIQSLETSMLS